MKKRIGSKFYDTERGVPVLPEQNLYKQPSKKTFYLFDGEKITTVRKLPDFPVKKQMIYGSQFIHPATMFRADALKAAGCYRVAEETRRGQDYDLFMRMYGMGMRGANLQIPVYRYTEDIKAIKRRSFDARVGEYRIRRRGYKEMGVYPWAFPFAFKPFAAHFVQKVKNLGTRR